MTNIVILVLLIVIGLVDECLGACDSKTCIGGACKVTTKSCNQACGWGKCDLTCTSSVRNCIQDCKWKDCKAISNAETLNQLCSWGNCEVACLGSTKQCNQICVHGGCNSKPSAMQKTADRIAKVEIAG